MTASKPLCVLSSLKARLAPQLTGKIAVCLFGLSSLGASLGVFIPQPALADQMYVSWYGPGFDGGYTANGEIFSRYEYTAAHPDWPFGTLVQLTNPNSGAVVTVRINDRSGGALDISEQAARDLGTYHTGIAPVEVDIIQWGE